MPQLSTSGTRRICAHAPQQHCSSVKSANPAPLNVTTGKDRPVGYLPGQVNAADIDSTGLVYANNLWTSNQGYVVKLVFAP